MKKKEWNEGLDHIDPDLIEKYTEQKDRLRQKKKQRNIWLRFGAIAACFALVLSAVIVVPMLREDKSGIIISSPNIPMLNAQIPTGGPQYYGSETSTGGGLMAGSVVDDPAGLSVTAQLVEVLPDTYVFFDDLQQCEFRLLRMKTVKLLKGKEVTDEFYYMIPVYYMTDFTPFDKFVILNMSQFGYEYSVMYNKTQSKAEQLNLVLFSHTYAHDTQRGCLLCRNIMAFDADGIFDERLWKSNEIWDKKTARATAPDNIKQAEKEARTNKNDEGEREQYVSLLKYLSGDAATVLSQIQSFENGIFVPDSRPGKNYHSKGYVNFNAVRYINGFATNESVRVERTEYAGEIHNTCWITKARFTEDDLKVLPDLSSAMASVVSAYDSGKIAPPHIKNYKDMKLYSYSIFGWYAKTTEGVIGIVRVSWRYDRRLHSDIADDAYYIIEYGSDECRFIDRDALLEKFGEYETTYIYDGKYSENGKEDWGYFQA